MNTPHLKTGRFLALIIALGVLSGCAMFGGGANESLPKARGYTVQPPANWKAEDRKDSDEAFRTPHEAIATLTSSCTRNSSAPKEALTRHLLIGARNIHFKKRETVVVDGAEGLFSAVRASYEGVPVHLELFVLTKAGCVFDFSLLSNKPFSADDSSAFSAFFRSFRYGKN